MFCNLSKQWNRCIRKTYSLHWLIAKKAFVVVFVCFFIYTEEPWATEGLLNFRKQPTCTQRTLLESSGKIPDAVAQEQYFSPYCTKSVNTWLNTFSAESPDPIYAVFMVGVWIERGGWSITWSIRHQIHTIKDSLNKVKILQPAAHSIPKHTKKPKLTNKGRTQEYKSYLS